MEILKKFYAEYSSIIASYIGPKTDWSVASNRLNTLRDKVSKIEIRYSKNSSFYNWIKIKLYKEISEEYIRTLKLSLNVKTDDNTKINRPLKSYISEIERTIGYKETIDLSKTYTKKLRKILSTMEAYFGDVLKFRDK